MEDTSNYDHFHVVAICVECADIDIIAIARDEAGLAEFFSSIDTELEEATSKASDMGMSKLKFKTKVVIPNQVVTITPENGHEEAHIVVAVVHKCKDAFDYCCDMQNQVVLKKMVNVLASGFLSSRRRKPEETEEKKATPKQDERARSLLESLDLPDDLFKGMN